jgi:hypothetical protein
MLQSGAGWVNSIEPFMSSSGQIDMSSVQPDPMEAVVFAPPASLPIPKKRPAFEPYESYESYEPNWSSLRRRSRQPIPSPPGARGLYCCGSGHTNVFKPGCYFASFKDPSKNPGAMLGKRWNPSESDAADIFDR